MTNVFEILGVDVSLAITEEELRSAFKEAGRSAHPDAGGSDAQFALIREAFEVLSSPSRRLKHWLELRGSMVDLRGVVDPGLMDLFGRVGEIVQGAENLIRRRNDAKSALVLALLERETQMCRELVEDAIREVELAIREACSGFAEMEKADYCDVECAARTVRNLAFLEKWRANLRSVFSRLV